MRADDLFMFVTIMALIAAGTKIIMTFLRGREARHLAKLGRSASDGTEVRRLNDENGRLAGKVSRLEERIAVLERIATDGTARLDHEIEQLRDVPVRLHTGRN